jgi:outer membrane protein TolC
MKYILFITINLLWLYNLTAQQKKQSDTLKLSLAEAIQYALTNSPEQRNSLIEIEKAKYKVNEVTGIGLPQIGTSFDFRDQFELPVFVFPDPLTGEQTPIQVGTKYQSVAGLTLNQLIFDGTFFLGLKAAKEYVNLSKEIHLKNERDLIANVIKSYYLVLISIENKNLLVQNLETLNNTLSETQALYKEGFVEELEVDRLKLAVSNLEVQHNKIQNQVLISEMFLKNFIGMNVEHSLVLTTDLDKLNETLQNPDVSILTENITNREEIRIMEQEYELSKLDLKRYQVSRYPTLRGFVNYQEQTFNNEFKFNPWYSTGMWGLSLNIPLFDGGSTKSRINQARLSVIQAENKMDYAINQFKTDYLKSRQEYMTAIETSRLQKANFDLAQKIFRITEIKYKEGVGSNLELMHANQELKNAQTNYLNAVYDLLIAKLNIQISSGLTLNKIE